MVYKFVLGIRDRIVFYLNSGPKLHDSRVRHIQKEIREYASTIVVNLIRPMFLAGKKAGQSKSCARPGLAGKRYRIEEPRINLIIETFI